MPFLSSSKIHEIFIAKQKSLGHKREVTLKKLSDTRWTCHHEAITAVVATFKAVLETAQQVVNGPDRTRAIKASGLMSGLMKFSFVMCLVIFKNLLRIFSKLSNLLQAESLDLGSASVAIQATIDTIEEMRSETKWQLLWDEAEAFATHNGIEVEKERPKRLSRTPLMLQNSIITAQSTGSRETPVNHYRVQVYYQTRFSTGRNEE